MQIMRNRAFYIAIIFFVLVACTSGEEKIKDKFTKKIDKELKLLQEKEMERRNNPECKTSEFAWDKSYHTTYWVFTGYEYDISKTDSIVSPYTAKVQYKGISYLKEGNTLEDCLNSNWIAYANGRETKLFLQQKYTYQDGEWILKQQEGRP